MDPSERAMLVSEASEALVRVGRAAAAMDLYRRAWPAGMAAEDARPELTARWRIATLCHQSVVQWRLRGETDPALTAEMQTLLAPITPARFGRPAYCDIRWTMLWADALGGQVAKAVKAVRDLDDQERMWWRLPDLLAAAWRCGYRDAVESATRDLLREDRSQRQTIAYSRLRVGDLSGAQRYIGRLEALEAWRWAETVAVDRALAGQHEEAVRWAEGANSDDWRLLVMRQLVLAGRYADADRYAQGQKFDPADPGSLAWNFIRGDPALILAAVPAMRGRRQALCSMATVLLGDWPAEPQRSAAVELRRLVRGWPCESSYDMAYAMASAAIEGDWDAVLRLRREARELDDDPSEEVVRSAVIALADAGRGATAELLLQRCADAPCADFARSYIVAAELRQQAQAMPQALLTRCTSSAGRRRAISLMLAILVNRWLDRPLSRGLDWMDPRDGM